MVEKSHTAGLWPSLYEPFRSMSQQMADWFAPASEASLNGDTYNIVLELPGVEDKDIDVAVNDGVVTIKGEKKTSREEKGETWYFSERQYGSFSRSFRLPADADGSKVGADLKDGVLTITVPKTSETTEEPKKIKIKKS